MRTGHDLAQCAGRRAWLSRCGASVNEIYCIVRGLLRVVLLDARGNGHSTRVAERVAQALLQGEGTVVVVALNKLLSEAPRTAPRSLMLRNAKHLGSA